MPPGATGQRAASSSELSPLQPPNMDRLQGHSHRQPVWLLCLMFIAHALPLSIAVVVFLQNSPNAGGAAMQLLIALLVVAAVLIAVRRLVHAEPIKADSPQAKPPQGSSWPLRRVGRLGLAYYVRQMGGSTWTVAMAVACALASAVSARAGPELLETNAPSITATAVALTYSIALMAFGKKAAAWVSLGGLLSQGSATLAAYVLLPSSQLEVRPAPGAARCDRAHRLSPRRVPATPLGRVERGVPGQWRVEPRGVGPERALFACAHGLPLPRWGDPRRAARHAARPAADGARVVLARGDGVRGRRRAHGARRATLLSAVVHRAVSARRGRHARHHERRAPAGRPAFGRSRGRAREVAWSASADGLTPFLTVESGYWMFVMDRFRNAPASSDYGL